MIAGLDTEDASNEETARMVEIGARACWLLAVGGDERV